MQNIRQLQFYDRCESLGILADKTHYWYHTIDLGHDVITPGVFDFRNQVPEYRFPENLSGQKILDVGAATGFFSFEFASRGGIVIATELTSLKVLDVFPGQSINDLLGKGKKYILEQIYHKPEQFNIDILYKIMLYEPFDFCCKYLGYSIDRRFVTIYDLSPTTLGVETFDWVFIGDVLLHTIDPLKALASAAKMCSGTLVVAQFMSESNDGNPNMLYIGGKNPTDDVSAWWRPNLEWFKQVLRKLGFCSVEVVGNFTDEFIPNGHSEKKTIIHAKR